MILKAQRFFLLLIFIVVVFVGLYAISTTFLNMAGAINLDQLIDRLIMGGRLGFVTIVGLTGATIVLEAVKVFQGMVDFLFDGGEDEQKSKYSPGDDHTPAN